MPMFPTGQRGVRCGLSQRCQRSRAQAILRRRAAHPQIRQRFRGEAVHYMKRVPVMEYDSIADSKGVAASGKGAMLSVHFFLHLKPLP